MTLDSPPARRGRFPLSALALAGAIALVGMPVAAHAATVTYYQAVRANNSTYMDPPTKTLTGGSATCSGTHLALNAHARTTNVTGLSFFASVTAGRCGPASMTHVSYIGRAGCKWWWGGSGGADPLNLTCKRVSP